MLSDFPTLDLLERCGMRAPFMVLILGARSGSHLQRLHDEVIPENCRLPRQLFINLKKERERMFGPAPDAGTKARQHKRIAPSDELLLAEFNRARTRDRYGKNSLFEYVLTTLSEHGGPKSLNTGITSKDGLLKLTPIYGGKDNVLYDSRIGQTLPCVVRLCHLVREEPLTKLPNGNPVPGGTRLFGQVPYLLVRIGLRSEQVTGACLKPMLALPKWRTYHTNDVEGVWVSVYELRLDGLTIPKPRSNGNIRGSKRLLAKITDFLHAQGINLTITDPLKPRTT